MRYEEYIETNTSWCEKHPAHWQIVKFKSLFSLGKGLNITKADLIENGVPVISYGQVHAKYNSGVGLNNGLFRYVDKTYVSLNKQSLVHENDFIFADTSEDREGCGNCVFVDSNLILFAGYHSIIARNKGAENNKYIAYQFLTDMWRTQIRSNVDGVKVFSVTKAILNKSSILLPPREEQDQIVRYLDWKVSCINKLIHGYQRQIKLLEERRQTVIDRTTLEGIDGAKLKDSGTHWVKRIPENWEMVYSKKLFSERKDKAFPNDEQLTASQKYGVISQKEFIEREGRRVTIVLTGSDILKHVGIGDFIISMRSFQGGLEYSYVEGKISSAYVMLIPRKEFVYDEYFKWLLKSKPYIKALQGTSDLVRDGQALRYANFAKVPLPQIPLDEQKRIAEYIERETAKIDASIPVFEKQIALLKEYRTRLISDVVTGQMDVRGIVVPEYVPETDEEDEEVDEPLSDAGEESEV